MSSAGTAYPPEESAERPETSPSCVSSTTCADHAKSRGCKEEAGAAAEDSPVAAGTHYERLIGDRKKVVYRLYREEELSPVAAADAGDACDPIAGQKGAGHHNSHRSGRSAINALSPSPFEPPSGPTGATE